jgi:hypothetical protein
MTFYFLMLVDREQREQDDFDWRLYVTCGEIDAIRTSRCKMLRRDGRFGCASTTCRKIRLGGQINCRVLLSP